MDSDKIDTFYNSDLEEQYKPLLNTHANYKDFIFKLESTNNPGRAKIAGFFNQTSSDYHLEIANRIKSKLGWIYESNQKYDSLYFQGDSEVSLDNNFREELTVVFFLAREDFMGDRKKFIELRKYQQRSNFCYGVIINAVSKEDYTLTNPLY